MQHYKACAACTWPGVRVAQASADQIQTEENSEYLYEFHQNELPEVLK